MSATRSIVPPTRWYHTLRQARLHQPRLRGSPAYWLQLEGSLTRHLQLRCQRFSVEVVREGLALPGHEEALTLNIPSRQLAWIREVCLYGDARPWVLARTIIPLATLTGKGRRLRHLGRTPLGAWLFSHQEWCRGPLQAGICLPSGNESPLWARRSVFASDRHQLLVGEYFLPDLLEQPI